VALLKYEDGLDSYGAHLFNDGTIFLSEPNSGHYERAMDILRNEKPVNIYFNRTNNMFILSCGSEPTGEEETRELTS